MEFAFVLELKQARKARKIKGLRYQGGFTKTASLTM